MWHATAVPRADFAVTANPVLDCRRGGSYSERSFLRAAVVSNPERADRVLVCFGRGSTAQDHKLVVQVSLEFEGSKAKSPLNKLPPGRLVVNYS